MTFYLGILGWWFKVLENQLSHCCLNAGWNWKVWISNNELKIHSQLNALLKCQCILRRVHSIFVILLVLLSSLWLTVSQKWWMLPCAGSFVQELPWYNWNDWRWALCDEWWNCYSGWSDNWDYWVAYQNMDTDIQRVCLGTYASGHRQDTCFHHVSILIILLICILKTNECYHWIILWCRDGAVITIEENSSV